MMRVTVALLFCCFVTTEALALKACLPNNKTNASNNKQSLEKGMIPRPFHYYARYYVINRHFKRLSRATCDVPLVSDVTCYALGVLGGGSLNNILESQAETQPSKDNDILQLVTYLSSIMHLGL